VLGFLDFQLPAINIATQQGNAVSNRSSLHWGNAQVRQRWIHLVLPGYAALIRETPGNSPYFLAQGPKKKAKARIFWWD
jgi:hypothetical protein